MADWANRITRHGSARPAELEANPRNWRLHPQAQQDAVAQLLQDVGWVQDVIVNERTGHIVDGHLRVHLAIERHEPEIPVVYVDLTEDEEALVLASLDPLAGMALTDEGALAELLQGISAEGALERLLDGMLKAEPKAGKTDPDAVPEAEPVAKRGDLWLLGDHRLLCGDSRSTADVMRLFEGDAKAALLWTDPPYGVDYVGKTAEALTIKNDDSGGLPSLLSDALSAAGTVLSPGSPFYIARPAGALSIVFSKAVEGVGWSLHEELQWVKDAMVLGHSDYHLRHETIMYGWLPGEGRSGRGKHDGSRWFGDNRQTSVFEIARPKASRDHPTMKPVELVERCLLNSSRRGDVVFDPFLGSGTTLIACERLGRQCFGLELAPRYVDVIVRRWEEFTGLKAEQAKEAASA